MVELMHSHDERRGADRVDTPSLAYLVRSGDYPQTNGVVPALTLPASARIDQTTWKHAEAGVRVSMLRPRFRWSSISAAEPIMRP